MEELKMRPTRDGFGEGLVELGATNKDVVVLCADLTDSTRAGWFKAKYPERFFGMGVSEQDMFGTAAGMALSGKTPFACTFGVFASGRAWDQIRVSICYMNLNVKVVGSHGGISVGADGATHQALEEITLMRALPNMTVIVPADFMQAKKATIQAASYKGPVYLRLGRCPVPIITKEQDPFEIGKAQVLKEGDDVTIFACGFMVYQALEAVKILEAKGTSVRLVNLHTPKPIDREEILKSARKTAAVVTCEEHTVMGGFGSAVAEVLAQVYPVPVEMVAIMDRFGESGEPDELMEVFQLAPHHIVKAVQKVIKRRSQ